MKQFIFISIFAVLIILVQGQGSENNLGVSVKLVEKFESFIAENPNATLVQSLQKSDVKIYSIRYTFGKIVGGEEALADESQSFNYPSPQNVEIKFRYPKSGDVGPYRITAVEIFVEQTTSLGNAYIYSGGIEQYKIGIVLSAQETTMFNYSISVYGY